MPNNSIYKTYLETEPKALLLNEETPYKRIRKVYLRDSIFDFMPYAELEINDDEGAILDNVFFSEGMIFNLKFGIPEVKGTNGQVVEGGLLSHSFCWSEYQVPEGFIGEGVVGYNKMILTSKLALANRPKTVAFKKPISDIVDEVLTKQLGVNGTFFKKNITKTTNNSNDVWYQAGRTPEDFLDYLASRAYTTTNVKNSNFVTFCNLNNTIYFQSFMDLYNQTPVKEIETGGSDTATLDSNTLRRIKVIGLGMPESFRNYNNSYHKVNSDGSFTDYNKTIPDLDYTLNNQSKKIIMKDLLNETTSINSMGVCENVVDLENCKSKELLQYINMNSFYQIIVETRFDAKYVSGNIIKFNNKKDNTLPISFLSGNWLITRSEHLYVEDGNAYTTMYLAKPSINITNKYFNFKNT